MFLLLVRKGEIEQILATSPFMKELQNQIGIIQYFVVCVLL